MRNARQSRSQTGDQRAKGRSSSPNSGHNGRGSAASGAQTPRRMSTWQILVLVSLTAGVYLVVIAGRPPLGVRLGQLAPRKFVSRISFQCEDIERTRVQRELAAQRAPLVFNASKEGFQEARDALLSVISDGEESPHWEQMDAETRQALADVRPLLRRQRGSIEQALNQMAELPVAIPSKLVREAVAQGKPIVVYEGRDTPDRTLQPGQMMLLSPAWAGFGDLFADALRAIPADDRAAVLGALARALRPTVVLDEPQTFLRARAAAEMRQPVVMQVSQGATLLAEGEPAREQHIAVLEVEREQDRQSPVGRQVRNQRLVGLALILLAVVGLGGAYSARYRPELIHNKLQSLSFALLTLALVAVTRAFVLLGVPVLCTAAAGDGGAVPGIRPEVWVRDCGALRSARGNGPGHA